MTKNFETVFVTIVKPRNGDCGVVEEGRYRTEGYLVVLVDIHGNPRLEKGKPIQHKLKPGETARSIAHRLTRQHIPDRRGDFNRKIIYPNVGKF